MVVAPAPSEARRKEGGVYGVRNGGGVGNSDVTHESFGDGRRYHVKAPSQLVTLLLSAPHLIREGLG